MMARLWLPPLLLVVALYLARDVLTPFVIAAVLAYVFSPVVTDLSQRCRVPRVVVVAVLYVVFLGLIGLGIWLLGGRLVREVRLLSLAGPDLVDAAVVRLLGNEPMRLFGQRIDPHTVADWINVRFASTMAAPADAFHVLEQAVEVLLKTFLMLIALFYLLLDGQRLGPYVGRFIPAGRRPRVREVGRHVHLVLGRYVRGQLFLIVLMSTVTYIVLSSLFHLHYALPIALLTGVLEVIPFIGPVIAGATAATVAFVQDGPQTAIWVIVAYSILRQAEDQLIMPIVVGRAVHLHPLVTIFAVLAGAQTAGVLGALLAVPIAAALRIILDEMSTTPATEPSKMALGESSDDLEAPLENGATHAPEEGAESLGDPPPPLRGRVGEGGTSRP